MRNRRGSVAFSGKNPVGFCSCGWWYRICLSSHVLGLLGDALYCQGKCRRVERAVPL